MEGMAGIHVAAWTFVCVIVVMFVIACVMAMIACMIACSMYAAQLTVVNHVNDFDL